MTDRTIVYRIQADLGNLKAQMAQASASVKDAGDRMTAANRQGAEFRQGLDTVGKTAGLVGAVAAAGLGAVVVTAANFDQSMSNVQAATMETAGNMDLLRDAAIDAGASTAFSATEAAAGIENLAKAGVSTQDVLAGGLAGALDLAAAGEMGVAEAAEAAATAMTQFGLAGSDVPHIADLLAAGAGKAQGEVTDLSQALNQSGLVAGQMGASLEETVGTLAAFASAGLLGSDAGTSFKTMLLRLANPAKDAREAMEEFGISAYDANGEMVSMTDLAGQLSAAFSGQDQATRDAALATIFGSDAIRAANVLYSQGAEGIADWTDKVDDSGYAAEQAAMRLDNLKGDWEEFTGAMETALIGTGDSAQGPLRELVQGLTGLTNAYNDLPVPAKTATLGVLGVTAAAGAGVFIFSKAVTGIAAMRVAMAQLSGASAGAGRAMRGVTAAGVGLAGAAAIVVGIEAIQDAIVETLPGMETLELRLINLAGADMTQSVYGLGAEFDNLGGSIDRLASKSWDVNLADKISGVLPGESKSLREAEERIAAIDAGLASLVGNGNADIAAASLENLRIKEGLTEAQLSDLVDLMPAYEDALAGQAKESKLAEIATDGLGNAVVDTAADAEESAKRMAVLREAAAETAGQFVTLGDSLNDSKVSLSEWVNQLAEQAQALRDFTSNAERAANKGLRKGLIAALQEAGPEGALRMKQLANATDEEIGRANKAWGDGQKAARNYIDTIAKADVPDIENVITTVFRTRRQGDQTPGFGPVAEANGGVLSFYANGGVENHVAQIAPAGAWRVWAEPETGGEAYIPLSPSKRERSLDIWAETGRRLGAMSFADGGTTGKPRTPAQKNASALASMREDLRALRRDDFRLDRALERLAAGADAASDAFDRTESTLDGWRDKAADVGAGSVAGFGLDLFARPDSIWSGEASGPEAALAKQIAGLRERESLQSQFSTAGMSGDAFGEFFSQGSNADLQAILTDPSRIAGLQAQYDQYAALRGAVASSAGQYAYGPQLAAAERQTAAAHEAAAQADRRAVKAEEQRSNLEKTMRNLSDEIAKKVSTPAGAGAAGGRGRKQAP